MVEDDGEKLIKQAFSENAPSTTDNRLTGTYTVVADLIIGTKANDVCKDILNGSKQMLGATFIIGMATAISGIMNCLLYTSRCV